MDDQHLKDFYAGLAMMGILSAGRESAFTQENASTAWDVAEAMMEERNQRKEQSVND